jgi:uncharacterized protein YjbI with pentapeptide repeats
MKNKTIRNEEFVNIKDEKFDGCTFSDCKFTGLFDDVDFMDCIFSGETEIDELILKNCSMRGCTFTSRVKNNKLFFFLYDPRGVIFECPVASFDDIDSDFEKVRFCR